MKVARLTFLAVALFAVGCTTTHHTYTAPSDAKVKATQKTLSQKVARARATATSARTATLKAQVEAQQLVALAQDVKAKLAILASKVSPDLVPLVNDVSESVVRQEQMEGATRQDVDAAVVLNDQLMSQQKEEEVARVAAIGAADEYAGGAAGLAQEATDMREQLIATQKQLIQQRIFSLLWKIGGGLVVLGIIVLVFLWFTGRLAFRFAK